MRCYVVCRVLACCYAVARVFQLVVSELLYRCLGVSCFSVLDGCCYIVMQLPGCSDWVLVCYYVDASMFWGVVCALLCGYRVIMRFYVLYVGL